MLFKASKNNSLPQFTPWCRWFLGGLTWRGCSVFSAYVYYMVQVVPGRSVRSLVGDLERLFYVISLCLLHGVGGSWVENPLPGGGPGEAVLCSLLMFTPWCRWYLDGVCAPWWGTWRCCSVFSPNVTPYAGGTWAECALPGGGPGEAVLWSPLMLLHGAGGTWAECTLPGGGPGEAVLFALSLCLLHGAGGTWAECVLPGGGLGEAVLWSLLMFTPWCRW
jgi:hypothetical protein